MQLAIVLTNKRARYVALWFLVFSVQAAGSSHHLPASTMDMPRQGVVQVKPSKEPIQPIPEIQIDPRKFRLGKRLFHEKRLHKHRKKSCHSCHNFSKGGGDGKTTVTGQNPKTLGSKSVNTPTIFNVIYNDSYYWRGQFQSLEQQLDDAVLELNDSWEILATIVAPIPSYHRAFYLIYPAGVTAANVKDALKYYVRSLNTPNSPFDQYLRGHINAISRDQKRGYQLFKSYGCIACHQGINVGGNLTLPLQEITLDKFSPTLANTQKLSENLNKQNKIRVPSLRNVALTGPYLHDGSITTLETAVNHRAANELGMTIPKAEVDLIVRFLQSLTGELNGRML